MSLQQEVPSQMFTLPRVWEQVRCCDMPSWCMPICNPSIPPEASCLLRGLSLRLSVG